MRSTRDSACIWFVVFVLCAIGVIRLPNEVGSVLTLLLVCGLAVSGWMFMNLLLDVLRPEEPEPKSDDSRRANEGG